jgi:hypothetical protein
LELGLGGINQQSDTNSRRDKNLAGRNWLFHGKT